MKKLLSLLFVGTLCSTPGMSYAERVDVTLAWRGAETAQALRAGGASPTVLEATVSAGTVAQRREPLSDEELIVVGHDSKRRERYRVAVADPSSVRAEIFDPVTGQFEQRRTVTQEADQLRLALPHDETVRRLTIYRPHFDERGRHTLEPLFELDAPKPTREAQRLGMEATPPPVIYNGDPANRLDLVFLGDGYAASELSKYAQDVNAALSGFFNIEPYRSYSDFINVHRVDVVSSQSGVDHPERGIYRNTALDSTYYCSGIQRLICANTTKANNAAAAALPANARDQVIVLVNDSEYGGSGGAISVISTHSATVDLALHEVGHSFGWLADEYTTNPELCNLSEPGEANSTTVLNRSTTKWAHWIAASTPLPTPTNYGSIPGLYVGSRYCASGMYRPTNDSMMRSLGRPFDAINEEALIKRYYAYTRPIDAYSPTTTSVPLPAGQSRTFSITTPTTIGNTIAVSWYLDNALKANGTSYTLSANGVSTGSHTLRAAVRDTTSKVRKDTGNVLSQTRSWTVSVGGGCTSVPPVPANLTGTRLTSSSFRVNWNAASTATSYDLQRWTGSAWQDHATTADLSYTVSGLTGTQYVRIRARNSCGSSAYSNWIQID